MALVTAAEYKAWRGITGTDYDTLIGTLADTATRRIERLTGRTVGGFESTESPFTEQIDGTGTQVLRVSNGPITSITSIKPGKPGDYGTALDASGYTFRDRTILRLPYNTTRRLGVDDWEGGSSVWTEGFANYEVVYAAGSAVADIHDDLKRAAFVLMDADLDSRGRDIGKAADAIGNTNQQYATPADVEARVMQLIRPWRDPV